MKNYLLLIPVLLAFSCSEVMECGERYEGDDCLTEIRPRIITASKIELSMVPPLRPDGMPWDSLTNPLPDPLLELNDFGFSPFIPDLAEDETATFNVNYALNLDEEMVVKVYDNDTSPTDPGFMVELISSYTFPVYEKGAGFPESISMGEGPVVTIFLEYAW